MSGSIYNIKIFNELLVVSNFEARFEIHDIAECFSKHKMSKIKRNFFVLSNYEIIEEATKIGRHGVCGFL